MEETISSALIPKPSANVPISPSPNGKTNASTSNTGGSPLILPKPAVSVSTNYIPIPPTVTKVPHPAQSVPRPIYPKPSDIPLVYSRAFIKPDSNSRSSSRRLEYASMINPAKQLRIPSRHALRLEKFIPKSHMEKALQAYTENNVPTLKDYNQPSSIVQWICSHKLIPDCRTMRSETNLDKTVFCVNLSTGRLTSSSVSNTSVVVDPFSPLDRLRPTARLLTRLGIQLTRRQYSRMSVSECGCGKVRQDQYDGANSSDSPPPNAPILAENESKHLEWQAKPVHGRWEPVRRLCRAQRCPYIPSSMFLLHRHLELGHQHFVQTFPKNSGIALLQSHKSDHAKQSLLRRLSTPLVIDVKSPHVCFSCSVCVVAFHSTSALIKHIMQRHPFITAQPLTEPTNHSCAICGRGFVDSSTGLDSRCRVTKCGSFVHVFCVSDHVAHKSCPWSAQEAHILACLSLYPNEQSRLVLPMHLSNYLTQSTDKMINFGPQSIRAIPKSYALFNALSISSLWGDVVTLDTIGTPPNTLTTVPQPLRQANVSSVPKTCHIETTLPLSPLVNQIMTVVSAINNQPTTYIKSVQPSTCCLLATASSNSASLVSINRAIPTTTNTVHSVVVSLSAVTSDTSEISMGNKRNASPSTPGIEPEGKRAQLVVDLTIPKLPVNSAETNTVELTYKQLDDLSNEISTSNTDVGSADRWALEGDCLYKHSCEMCDDLVNFRTEREHMHKVHYITLGTVPAEFCNRCGQLFWTKTGLKKHRSIQCTYCWSKNLCKSTLYLHLALKHRVELIKELTVSSRCWVCHGMISDLVHHLQNKHNCIIPRDVLQELPDKRFGELNRNIRLPVMLSELAPLYIASLSVVRERPPNVSILPDNIVTQDGNNPDWLVFKCSVCQLRFISATQLDLHMLQVSHQYWCRFCSFTCTRLQQLTDHQSNSCEPPSKKRSVNLKFTRIPAAVGQAQNGVTPVLPDPPTVALAPVSKFGESPMMGPFSQFHKCGLCPVFCLTLEDLEMHRRTAHQVIKRQINIQYPQPPIQPRVAIQSATQSVYASLSAFGQQIARSNLTRIAPPPTNPNNVLISNLPIVQPTSYVAPPSRNIPLTSASIIILPATSAFSTQVTTTALPSTSVVVQPRIAKSAEELVCPMCEYHSTDRASIMKHITDSH